MEHTVRLTELAKITGKSRDSIRNDIAYKTVPWIEKNFEKGKQRRFSGSHVLALTIAEILIAQGHPAKFASRPIKQLFFEIERYLEEVENGVTSKNWVLVSYGSSSQSDSGNYAWIYGQYLSKDDNRHYEIADSNLAFFSNQVSIAKAYEMAARRASAVGFVLNGMKISRLSDSSK